MNKYSWDFNEDAEIWRNDTFDTVEECLNDARRQDELYGDSHIYIYIGENVAFAPCVDVETVLDICEENAADFCGQVGRDWDAYDHKRENELDELREAMDRVLHDWMKKHGYYPEIYSVEGMKRYDLGAQSTPKGDEANE